MDDQKIIADRIKTLTERLHIAQSPFASQAGISPTNLSKMLRGEMRITEKTLVKLANKYNVHYDWLAHGLGEMMDLERMQDLEQSETEIANSAFTMAADLLNKTLNEMAEQRQLIEKTLKMLESAIQINSEQSQALLKLINEKL